MSPDENAAYTTWRLSKVSRPSTTNSLSSTESLYTDFTVQSPVANTLGSVHTGQDCKKPSDGGAAPVINCPESPLEVESDADICGAVVYFSVSAVDAEDGILIPTQTAGPASGDVFPVGTTNVAFSVTDSDGNTVTCNFDVIVTDTVVPVVVCRDYNVALDADGMIEVDPNDLILSVSDNCSVTVGGAALPCTQSNDSNGFENGSAIDVDSQTANDLIITAGGSDFVLNQVSANIFHAVGETITSVDFYYYEDNAGAPGVQIGSQMGVVPISQNVVGNNYGYDVSEVVCDLTPFTFAADTSNDKTYWIGMKGISSSGGHLFWEDQSANITGNETYIFDGAWLPQVGRDGVYVFAAEGNGECGYDMNPIIFDCSDLGENSVDVSVMDAGGNVALCTATVIVSDVTAPVIECGPDPVLTGSASDTPYLYIPDNDAAGISTTIDVTEDVVITDLNVPVYIQHSWSGDLYVTLTSPAGTTVVLQDQTGDSTEDIHVTFDDEGDAPVDPLSDFDGETTAGTWTLFVSDNVPGETGMIVSWGIDYSYDNPSTDIVISLDENGEHTLVADDMLYLQEDACGIDVILTDVTDVDCSDIGTPIMVTVFANDPSGNYTSCQHEINVVDDMAPDLYCPDDMIVHTNFDGVYFLPDYFDLGEAGATDNCTADADIILTQDPLPGSVFAMTVGTANDPVHITFTATDDYGNTAICEFDLDICGCMCRVEGNSISDTSVSLQPNPASNMVRLVNQSDIALQTAMIYTIDGKLITTIDLSKNNSFSVANLPSGIYTVKIMGTDIAIVKRLLVQ